MARWPRKTASRVRTTIAILSYVDRLTFGITGDYDTTADIDTISAGITTETAALLAHARDRQATTAEPRARCRLPTSSREVGPHPHLGNDGRRLGEGATSPRSSRPRPHRQPPSASTEATNQD
ncbi:hypothetical protein [Nocardia asiatica]|uniref:hypothetical protein n=1 Tax=Nocardia asiatica TaxID=209252 RepID=UPI002455644D|nr:hypothetical protein [Nocardia asiatica]